MKHLGIVAIACASLVRARPQPVDPQDNDLAILACGKLDAGNDANCIDKSRECLSNSKAQGNDSHEHCLLMKYGKNGDVFEMVEKACLKLASDRDDACRAKAEECHFKGETLGFDTLDRCLDAKYGMGGRIYNVVREACRRLDSVSDDTCLDKSEKCLWNGKALGFDTLDRCLDAKYGMGGHIYNVVREACRRLDRISDDTCLDKSEKCLWNGKALGFNSVDQCLGVELGLQVLSPEQKKEKEEKQAQEHQN